jgi:hypothetical protein
MALRLKPLVPRWIWERALGWSPNLQIWERGWP